MANKLRLRQKHTYILGYMYRPCIKLGWVKRVLRERKVDCKVGLVSWKQKYIKTVLMLSLIGSRTSRFKDKLNTIHTTHSRSGQRGALLLTNGSTRSPLTPNVCLRLRGKITLSLLI